MRVDDILIRTLEASAAKGGLSTVAQMRARDPATPNGPSARNLTRLGFAHVQTQVVVGRRRGAARAGGFEDL